MTKHVGIFIFDDVEILDFTGPFEVFSTASRIKARQTPGASKLFEVFTIAETSGLVKARGGLAISPAYDFTNHPLVNVLVIPGGIVTAELQKPRVVAWVQQNAESAELTASVCTGAFLLGQAGLLNGKAATTHWEDIADLHTMFPKVSVQKDIRWIDEGDVITSAGISAGIDMSLHLIARLAGEELAIDTARQMEFDWKRK